MKTFPNRLPDLFWASCRMRTNDPEITNHVLWPTELKRHTGKQSTSHRSTYYPCYGQVLGGFARSWSYRTYTSAKLRLFSKQTKYFATFFLKNFIFLIFTITNQCFWTIFGQNPAISSQNCPQKNFSSPSIFLHLNAFFRSQPRSSSIKFDQIQTSRSHNFHALN